MTLQTFVDRLSLAECYRVADAAVSRPTWRVDIRAGIEVHAALCAKTGLPNPPFFGWEKRTLDGRLHYFAVIGDDCEVFAKLEKLCGKRQTVSA